MTKKHFISLADKIIGINALERTGIPGFDRFTAEQIENLADWCADQNPNFNRARWIGYIKGECGPNGGQVK